MRQKDAHSHTGQPIQVGPYTIYVAGAMHLDPDILSEFDVLIPLTEQLPPLGIGNFFLVLSAQLPDFGGVPDDWVEFLCGRVIPLLARCHQTGERVLCFCTAGHGRTGTLLASLIAILETEEETPDPIAAVRERHCHHAVETMAQAEGIFSLRGREVPSQYLNLR
ncbi:hypothetical protein KKF05_04870 [Patescibacteria group bacterium]|nr:hypothetical protein [Patescibacteria group bacterium]